MARTEEDAALVDRLAATIQARVLSGEFASGSRLRQESLATEFGVSRTPVREALRKLQAAGIVQLEPRPRRAGPRAERARGARGVRGARRARGARGGARVGAHAATRSCTGCAPRRSCSTSRPSGCARGRSTPATAPPPHARARRVDPRQRPVPSRDPRGGRQQPARGDARRPAPELPARPDVDRPRRELAPARGERRAARRRARGDRAARRRGRRGAGWSITS